MTETHDLQLAQGFFFDNSWSAHCSCGWSSKEQNTEVDAIDAWENHCDAVFIEATTMIGHGPDCDDATDAPCGTTPDPCDHSTSGGRCDVCGRGDDFGYGDLSDCPYFLGVGTCSYGCWEEPRCMTCQPMEGWPSGRIGVFSTGRGDHDRP